MSVTPKPVPKRGCWPGVDALLQAELTLLVIARGQLKDLRSRYGSAGNKDDRYDAHLLADVARTDRRRLHRLVRYTTATTALCTTVRAGREQRVANQLRAHLQLVFPAAASLFAILERILTAEPRPTPTPTSLRPCPAPKPYAPPDSLPRSATLAAGSQPQTHWPVRPAGAPSTRQSGEVKAVTLRRAAEKQLRDAIRDFASDSCNDSPFGTSRYDRAIARGHDHCHAVRILARAWGLSE